MIKKETHERRTNLPGTLRDVVAPKSTPRVDVHRPRRRRMHLTVVLNDELQFVETNDREWVILKDGITSDADAAAEGTRLVEEYVYYYY